MQEETKTIIKEYRSLTERVVLKLITGFFTGASASLALITIANIESWTELGTALFNIIAAIAIGGANGVIQAGLKFFTARSDYK